jgi:hypothetical protein
MLLGIQTIWLKVAYLCRSSSSDPPNAEIREEFFFVGPITRPTVPIVTNGIGGERLGNYADPVA